MHLPSGTFMSLSFILFFYLSLVNRLEIFVSNQPLSSLGTSVNITTALILLFCLFSFSIREANSLWLGPPLYLWITWEFKKNNIKGKLFIIAANREKFWINWWLIRLFLKVVIYYLIYSSQKCYLTL